MKRILSVLIACVCASVHLYADANEERCVLEEYNGRQSHTPLVGVDVKVKGSNWTTTDVEGNFTLSFRYPPEKISDFQFVKDGYVIFNRDAVEQWRPSDSDVRFRVVLCKQKDLRDRIEQYWGVFESRLRALYDEQLKEIEKLKLSVKEREERISLLEKEYQSKSREYDELSQQYAYIDESECSEEYYQSLKLFKEGKIDESLQVFRKFKLGEKVDVRLQTITRQKSDLRQMLPMLVHESEIYRLNGSRDEDSLLVTLNRIVRVCKELNDTTNNTHLAKALYGLGKLHEPLVMDYCSSVLDGGSISEVSNEREDSFYAEQCFRESAAYGNVDAMYSLGCLYEYRGSILYNLNESRKWYNLASSKGHKKAAERMHDFYDFGVRMPDGYMLYFKILSDSKKGRSVKLTYLDQTYCSSVDNIKNLTEIPSCVEYKSRKYYVKEIGKSSLRVAFLGNLTVPEGVEVLNPSAFRSTMIDTLMLPSSLRKIECEIVPRFWVKNISIDESNRFFYVDDDGNVRRYADDSIALELEKDEAPSIIDNSGVAFKTDTSLSFPENLIYEHLCEPNYYYNSKVPSCILPTDRDTIPEKAMYYTAIKTLTIPENYKEIKEEAFYCDHYLYDVMIASPDTKMSKRSFSNSEFSDMYVFGAKPSSVDKTTFEDGRRFRTIHVPQGSAKLYEQAKGWSQFSMYVEDMCGTSPFYEALCLRKEGKFKTAKNVLEELRRTLEPETPEFKMCNYHLAMMAYQTGDISDLEPVVRDMISEVDTADVAYSREVGLYYLNLNLLACRMARQEGFVSINTPEVISKTLKYAISSKQYDILSVFADEWDGYLFNEDMNSCEVLNNASYYIDVLSCLREAHEINLEESFVDSLDVSFKNEVIGVVESLMKRARIVSENKDSYDFRESVAILQLALTPEHFEIDRISSTLDDLNSIFAEDKVSNIHFDNVRLWGNIYIYSKTKDDAIFNDLLDVAKLGENIYSWLMREIDREEVREYMSYFCEHTDYEYRSLKSKLYETIDKIERKVSITLEKEFSRTVFETYRENGDFYHLLDYLLDFATVDSGLLQIIGKMCLNGMGVEKSEELAVRFFAQSYKQGNKDVLLLLATTYWDLKDFDNALKYFSLMDFPLKYYGQSLIYSDWNLGHFDIYKSYENLKKLLVDGVVEEKLRQEFDEQLEKLSALANTMAYDEMRANNKELALAYIDLAIEMKPKEANFYDSKAEILYYFGETDYALVMWEKVIGLDSEFLSKYNSSVYYQLRKHGLIENDK